MRFLGVRPISCINDCSNSASFWLDAAVSKILLEVEAWIGNIVSVDEDDNVLVVITVDGSVDTIVDAIWVVAIGIGVLVVGFEVGIVVVICVTIMGIDIVTVSVIIGATVVVNAKGLCGTVVVISVFIKIGISDGELVASEVISIGNCVFGSDIVVCVSFIVAVLGVFVEASLNTLDSCGDTVTSSMGINLNTALPLPSTGFSVRICFV